METKQPKTKKRKPEGQIRGLSVTSGSPPIPKVSACCEQPMREGEYCPECNEHSELIPDPEAVWTLGEIRPGLFLFGQTLCLKTEYPGDVFVCASGEAFWGGTNNRQDLNALAVIPITLTAQYGEAPANTEGQPPRKTT